MKFCDSWAIYKVKKGGFNSVVTGLPLDFNLNNLKNSVCEIYVCILFEFTSYCKCMKKVKLKI